MLVQMLLYLQNISGDVSKEYPLKISNGKQCAPITHKSPLVAGVTMCQHQLLWTFENLDNIYKGGTNSHCFYHSND